ncbi:uncharacterized protein Hap1MRO34_023293 [Clarias gariepinus]
MSVYEKNTSLIITAVNISDTGLYYCSYRKLDVMIFSNSTSLHVKGRHETVLTTSDREKVKHISVFSTGIFMLTLVSVITILLTALILILKHRKALLTGAEGKSKKNGKKFSKKEPKRSRDELEYSCVVYSPVSQ